MAKRKRILVTGGLGLIGTNVVKLLQSTKQDVRIIDALTTYGTIDQTELEDLYNQRLTEINTKTQIYKEDICIPEIDQIFEDFQT